MGKVNVSPEGKVELSIREWPPHVREAFEVNLRPLFDSEVVEGMQMSWHRESSGQEGRWYERDVFVWQAWGAAEKWEYAIHRFEYRYRSV